MTFDGSLAFPTFSLLKSEDKMLFFSHTWTSYLWGPASHRRMRMSFPGMAMVMVEAKKPTQSSLVLLLLCFNCD